ncbi:aldo/keto reductase [Halorarius litoreus]|uniref:aldo/keto reductase n=1 Tax=Halorarius litoreus TaxID=2962676 RepID=UPI0020CEB56B|nr:aldo/keto reductase [Halorarius litoreus]
MALDFVPLGSTGTQVSELCFGTWRYGRENDDGEIEIDRARALDLLSAYADAGGNFIDTADVYGGGLSEQWIGDWLADRDRDQFVLASKVYWPTREDDPNGRGLSRKHIRRQIDLMLDRLGTDYLDLLYIHRWDDATPAAELMRTLDGLVRDGKVHYLGTSTFEPNAWRIAQANELARREGYEPFTVAQPRYSLVTREVEYDYVDACAEYDIGMCPWSPLGGGVLTGKYDREQIPEGTRAAENDTFADRYLTEANFDALDVVEQVADEVDASPAQVSLAWLMHHEQVTAPIVGARTVEQLEENLAAAAVELTDDQYERLADAKTPPSLV